jgi:hypothetical protein
MKNRATAGEPPDAIMIRECRKYAAAARAYEAILLADTHDQRRAELIPFRARRDRAAAKICTIQATTPAGQRALAAAIDIDTRDDGDTIQGQAVQFIDILLRGILGKEKLTASARPDMTMTEAEQAAAFGKAERIDGEICLKTVPCWNCAVPCRAYLDGQESSRALVPPPHVMARHRPTA